MRSSACVWNGPAPERRRSRARQAEPVDALEDDPEVDRVATSPIGARTGLDVPLLVGPRSIGVIVAHDKEGEDPRFSDDDLRLAEIFAARAAVAVHRRRALRATRSAASSRRSSCNDVGSPASSTTRPGRS